VLYSGPRFIDVDMAYTLGMAENGDMGVVLNITYEGIEAAWNEQIDKPSALSKAFTSSRLSRSTYASAAHLRLPRRFDDCKKARFDSSASLPPLKHDGLPLFKHSDANLR